MSNPLTEWRWRLTMPRELRSTLSPRIVTLLTDLAIFSESDPDFFRWFIEEDEWDNLSDVIDYLSCARVNFSLCFEPVGTARGIA